MKKMIKLLLCFIVLFTNICFLGKNVKSDEIENNEEKVMEINEYDIMVSKKRQNELFGLNKNQIDTIVSTEKSYEQLYLERAKIDEDVLIKYYGYSEEQVEILKEYDGTPIEENPQLAAASATMSLTMSSGSCTTSQLTAYIIWRWSNAPLLSGPGITDRVAIRWRGTASTGALINLAVSKAEIIINYHYDGAYVRSQTVSSTIIDQYCKAETPVLMDNGYGTALVGKQTLVINKIGSLPIKEASIAFMYGHCGIGASVSFSYPISFSISLETGEQSYYFSKRVTSTGQILGV